VNNFIQMIRHVLSGNTSASQRKKWTQYAFVVGSIGVLLLMVAEFISTENKPTRTTIAPVPSSAGIQSQAFSAEQELEQRLQQMLERLPGVSDVKVMIVLDSTEQLVVQQNHESNEQVTNELDRNGATRQINEQSRQVESVMQQVDGGQQPLVVQKIQPKVRGVLVIATGADRPTIKKMILDAVQKSLKAKYSAISILPSDIN
jgi:stage III sporulation protein AG